MLCHDMPDVARERRDERAVLIVWGQDMAGSSAAHRKETGMICLQLRRRAAGREEEARGWGGAMRWLQTGKEVGSGGVGKAWPCCREEVCKKVKQRETGRRVAMLQSTAKSRRGRWI